MKFTSLYGLFALVSLVLFNAFVLLARFARQIKAPPTDDEFEKLMSEKNEIKVQADQEHQETVQLKDQLAKLEAANKQLEESLKTISQELETLKKPPEAQNA